MNHELTLRRSTLFSWGFYYYQIICMFPWLLFLHAWRNIHCSYEPRHDKTNKESVRLAETQISLGICPVWSESSLSAWRKLGSLATHSAHSEDSDQTGWMPRLIWVFAGCTVTLFVLSCCGSYIFCIKCVFHGHVSQQIRKAYHTNLF